MATSGTLIPALRLGDQAVLLIVQHMARGYTRALAEQLNLGLDSFVFLDDNPFERNLVRQLLAFSRSQTLQPKVLDLTDANGLDDHPRFADRVEHPHRLRGREREPAEMPARRHGANEHPGIERHGFHPNAVAK